MGWAEGINAGINLGNLVKQGMLQSDLAEESKKHRIEETIPDQGKVDDLVAQRDQVAQGLIAKGVDSNEAYQQATQQMLPQFQETSQAAGVGRQYSYGGQTFGDRREAEMALSAGRTQALANVYRERGELDKASALESQALQNRAASLQVKGLERTEREQALAETLKGEDKKWWETRLTAEDGTRRPATAEDMLAAAQRGVSTSYSSGNFEKGNASYSQYMDLAEKQIIGQERERNRDREKAFAAVQSGNLQAGIDFYNKYLPNGSVAKNATMDKNGMITVEHTDMSGTKLPDTKLSKQQLLEGISAFGDSKQALAYVQQSFMNNIHTQELGLKKKSVEQTGEYYKARMAAEKMGSAQTFNDDKGDTYMVVPKMGKDGISFETQKVNPEGAKFKKPGAEGSGKFVEAKEEGTKGTIDGKPVVADGMGGWIPADGNGRPKGVLPSERTKVLKEAGVPENLVGQIPWNKTGTGILFQGKEYDPKDPKDLKTMVETYKRLGAADIAMQEASTNDVALQQKFRGLNGQQPSVMREDPLLWQLYRRQEQNRGLIPNLDLNRYDVP